MGLEPMLAGICSEQLASQVKGIRHRHIYTPRKFLEVHTKAPREHVHAHKDNKRKKT